MKKILNKFSRAHIILAIILFSIFIFRLPSLYEPFWYGDEGIFAAVASNLNQGGTLYRTAWDNKPPMIYVTYAAIFKYFGVSMFSLRIVTLVVVMATTCAIYGILEKSYGLKRALVASFLFGFLSSMRLIEGNLSLTEIFMIFPITLAMLLAIRRNFDYIGLVLAGFLFAIASLYKQVGAFEAAALGIFLFFQSKNFMEFFKRGLVLGIGFSVPYVVTIFYFLQKGLFSEYIFAAYTYYRIYLGESPKYAQLVTLLKLIPVITAIVYGIFKKLGGKRIEISHLFLLWVSLSFLGSYFSGRTYGHYLVQATPAVAILAAIISFKVKLRKEQIAFGILFFLPIIFLTKFLFSDFISGGPINQLKYWGNFVSFAVGTKGLNSYNDYFDKNVNTIMGLNDFLIANNAQGSKVYIWGDMSWLYAVSNLKNPSRYVTSFHVFGVPNGKEEVAKQLTVDLPDFIIRPASSIGYFSELETLQARRYTLVSKVETAEIYARKK